MAEEGFGGDVDSKALLRTMNGLPEGMRSRVYTVIMREAVKPVTRRAKKNLKKYKDTGAHERSLKSKVIAYKKGGTVYGIIGHDYNHIEMVTPRGTKKPRKVRPAKTAHLLELGTSKDVAKPYMRPALESSKEEVFNVMSKGIDKGLAKEITRLNR